MARVAAAGRAIAWASDESWHDIKLTLNGTFFSRNRRERDLGDGLLLRDARVCLGDETRPVTDPAMVLQVARAAAAGRRPGSGSRRSTGWPRRPDCPNRGPTRREPFIELLLSGRPAISVIEALDQRGIWGRADPGVEADRSLPQRNPYHRYTVDRHLLEAVAEAVDAGAPDPAARPAGHGRAAARHRQGPSRATTARSVSELARQVAARRVLRGRRARRSPRWLRHHLLLLDVATRRDLDDPATIEFVARTVQTPERLAILRSLSEADSIATGTLAWGPWKSQLARATHHQGRPPARRAPRSTTSCDPRSRPPEQRALLDDRRMQVIAEDERITVACPDRVGVVYRVAGALAPARPRHHRGDINSEAGMVVDEFRVAGPGVGDHRLGPGHQRRGLALEGKLAIAGPPEERVRQERRRHQAGLRQLPSSVRFDNDASARRHGDRGRWSRQHRASCTG